MIKRLIFDIDGTLITGVSFDKAIKNSLLEHGFFSEENKQKFIYAISTYENNHSEYEPKQYLQYFSQVLGYQLNKDFFDTFFRNLGLYAIPDNNKELIETIEKLSEKYELVLLSNYFEKSQRGRLKHIGIDKYFIEYYGEKICKPNKQAFLDAMIGDHLELDINGAKKCGINTIWVNSKNIENNNIQTISVDNINEISQNLIESLNIDIER